MSDKRQEIKEAFDAVQELSGQAGKFSDLDNAVDTIIDKLNEFIESTSEAGEIEKAQAAIQGLLQTKDEDVASVKVYELESRGKKATKSKVRDYERQLDSAIDAVKANVSYFL